MWSFVREICWSLKVHVVLLLINHREMENNYVYVGEKISPKKRVVIYTCITGGYDDLAEPGFEAPNINYIVFCDEDKKYKTWKRKALPEAARKLNNNIYANRYVKFHAHEIFGNKYDYAIYVDGNVRPVGDLREMIASINETTGLSIHRHQFRGSIYDEAIACELFKRGDLKKMKVQMKRYRSEGFPKKFGLYECNVIAMDLKNKNAKRILNVWWEEFVRSGSMRDQLALPYVVWKNGYQFDDIRSLGNNVYKNPLVQRREHQK